MSTSTKKILFITPKNVAGGAERVMTSLANSLSLYNDVTFVTMEGKEDFYSVESRVKRIKLDLPMCQDKRIKKMIQLIPIEIKRIKYIKNILQSEKPDIVISFLFTTNIFTAICSTKDNIPFILSERSDPSQYSFVKKIIMKHYYSKSNGFVCQSEFMKEYAEKTYNLKNVEVIPNPISKNQYSLDRCDKNNKIISVGRLVPQKNQKMLIEAFKCVSNKHPDYTLHIFGSGPLKNDLIKLIKDTKMENKIFINDPQSEVIKNNRDAKIFVLSSDYEGYPNVLVEAMSNGIISISTDFSTKAARDIIIDRQNGFLINTNDIYKLSSLLDDIMENYDNYKYIEKEARKIIDKISIEKISKNWDNYINKIINKEMI